MKPNSQSNHGSSWRWHLFLVFVAIAFALLSLIRVPDAWSWEPLTWMSLVWWIVIAIVDGLVRERGQLSLRRFAVIASIIPVLIMFPFTGIALSHERAKWKSFLVTSPQPITRAGWGGWLKWHRLPDGHLVPMCLVWRVSPQGMSSRISPSPSTTQFTTGFGVFTVVDKFYP